ncbi:DUF445 domain-containing protein [Frankia sp. ACN1ag]|uniref:DUF445 domain-containing protein n=1 Tax=Frankia sp. ACN1ag TaxID=102891 RepID=UPI0006DC3B58|nr:DUF445 domain-containing protein [Frankia sp. ACN1ag]KQC35673.1 hypothetical protein UK82_25235 [Frankia sp. ACN1ag]
MSEPAGGGRPVPAGLPRGTADEPGLRQALRRMRLIATGLLAAVVTVYLLAQGWHSHGGPGWVAYVAAAAEAGVVGALADWFAVTALFRHPLGLPIPHTAIIPERKDALGRGLENFVSTHFLAEDVIRDKVDGIGVSVRVGSWLRQPRHAERVTTEIAGRLTSAISGMSDDLVREVVEKAVLPRVVERPWAGVLGAALQRVLDDRLHVRLVDVIVTEVQEWLTRNPELFTRLVVDQAPSWTPQWLDEAVAVKAYDKALEAIAELRADPEHRVRQALDRFLGDFAGRLRADPSLGEQVEQIKQRLLGHAEVGRAVAAIWATTRTILLDLTTDPTSTARVRATDELAAFGARLATDPELGRTVDRAASDLAARAVHRYQGDIAAIIGDTVASWEPEETSRRIELHVGRDLQFIRINGTVVGALVGLLIHALTELVF